MSKNQFIKVFKIFLITWKYIKFSRRPDVQIDLLKKSWATEILVLFNLKLKVIGNPIFPDESCILVGNHIGYLDIPVLMQTCPDISFVSKEEVRFWPIIGNAAKKIKTIFVERKDKNSREKAKDEIAQVLLEEKQRVLIFPSGTTSIKTSSLWKKGAFEIAIRN